MFLKHELSINEKTQCDNFGFAKACDYLTMNCIKKKLKYHHIKYDLCRIATIDGQHYQHTYQAENTIC